MRRFDAYCSALAVLATAPQQDLTNEFVLSGIVDKFSIQFELGWKLLKDLLRYEGVAEAASGSPREVLKSAYRYLGLVDEGPWLSMLAERNVIAHVYDEQAARRLANAVISEYLPVFIQLREGVRERYKDELEHIA